jgi:hypothetical protein
MSGARLVVVIACQGANTSGGSGNGTTIGSLTPVLVL